MAKRNSTSAIHDLLAGLSLGAPDPLIYQFNADGANAGGLPGTAGRVRFEVGSEDAGNRVGDAGGSVKYRSFENLDPADTTAITNGYVEITAGTRDIRLTARVITLGTGNHSGSIFWRNINSNNGPIPGSIQGTYGQGSAQADAIVVVPAGATRTYTVRHASSANNQIVQPGSFILAEEVA